jgi:outer membrane protein
MRSLSFLALLLVAPALAAQPRSPAPRASLTLDEAIQIARDNNPAYRRVENTLRTADAQIRSTYGALLPSATATFGGNFQQGGSSVIQGIEFKAHDTYSTSYQLGLNYNISAGALYAPTAVRANREATVATITGSSEALRGQVTQFYLTALQSEAQAAVQDTLMQTSQAQLDLANARFKAGAATILDVRNAEVVVGQSQVAALNAHNAARVDRVRLGQLIGASVSPDAKLTTVFSVTQPHFSLDSLLALGQQVNPNLLAARAAENATVQGVKIAKMQYTPFLGISTGYGRQAVDTGGFPFSYSKRPYSVNFFLSVPVFNGFSREQQIENARINRDNATFDVKERELQTAGDITQAYGTLMTAAQTVTLQEKNAETARQALQFAEERYRVGAASFVDLTVARGQFEQAQIARVNSVYDYQKAFAGLETAVGRPLR